MGRTPGHTFCFPDLGSKRSSPAAGRILVRASPLAHTLPSGVGKEGSVPALVPAGTTRRLEEATPGSRDGSPLPGGCVTEAAGVSGPESSAATLGSARGC